MTSPSGSSSTSTDSFRSSLAMHAMRSVSLPRAWGTLTSRVSPSAKAAVTDIAGRASGVLFMSISMPLSGAPLTVTESAWTVILAPMPLRYSTTALSGWLSLKSRPSSVTSSPTRAAGTQEERRTGEVGRHGPVEGLVALPALDAELLHLLLAVLDALAVQPVQGHLRIAGLVQQRDVDLRVLLGQRRTQQQAGQVLARGAGDGGLAAQQLPRHFGGGLAVVVDADAFGPQIAEGIQQRADRAGSGSAGRRRR